MKLSKFAIAAAIAFLVQFGNVSAADTGIQLMSHCSASCDCGQPVCGCEEVGGCDTGCSSGGCDSGCDAAGCGLGGCLGGDCSGDPWTLFDGGSAISAGGWLQTGYHSSNLPLFNSHADQLNLHQAWFYAEKAIDTSNGFDIGGRIDYVYGVDAQDTQAFGIDNNHWDNGWDNGIYGHAIPQLYMEAGYGDWSVKAGHFYTIIGYEVVTAPDNFFYSHAYTMYNSEPFTHTGVLSTYNASDRLSLFGGYVMGWDSGFEDNGDAFIGGASLDLTDRFNLTYASITGVFDETNNFGGVGPEEGYMHSLVGNFAVNDKLNYIIQSDLLDSDDGAGNTVRDTFGINQYLLYSVNDCMAYGARFEWWGVDDTPLGDYDVYALTAGINYRPNANMIVRPEVRWDWIDGDVAGLAANDVIALEDNDDSQFTFGIDTIVTY